MPSQPQDHSRILQIEAKSVLAPLGLIQKGRSRTWLDDRIWHLIVVEFQPSGFSGGAYLNVGAMWLWFEKDYISFDYGHRVAAFESADGVWQAKAQRLSELAAERVIELRRELPDIRAAARILRSRAKEDRGWPAFHAVVATGLAGDGESAGELVDAILSRPARYGWEHEMQGKLRELRSLIGDRAGFELRVIEEILRTRDRHKLPKRPIEEISSSLGG